MIHYHPGTWAVCFAFQLKGSVFPKSFAWAAPCAVITWALHTVIRMEEFKDKLPEMEVGASVMSNFTFVLGFLIVFRVNQAYSRWWEGGALLQQIRGNWFNAYSSLLAFCNESKDRQMEVEQFKHTLARLISLLYSSAIHQVSTADRKVFECIDIDGLSPAHVEFMQSAHDRCEVILQWIQKLVVEANGREYIKIAPPILSRVYNQLGNGIVNLNNARKIAEFPIPFPLAQMITVMLLYHLFVTCIVCAFSINTGFWACMLAFVIVFSFQSINYIAVELENPFGDDANDLPLEDMPKDMNTSLTTLLEEHAMTVPDLTFDERHRQLVVKSVNFDTELLAMANGSMKELPSPKRRVFRGCGGHKAKIKAYKESMQRRRWCLCARWPRWPTHKDDSHQQEFQALSGDQERTPSSSSSQPLRPAPQFIGTEMKSVGPKPEPVGVKNVSSASSRDVGQADVSRHEKEASGSNGPEVQGQDNSHFVKQEQLRDPQTVSRDCKQMVPLLPTTTDSAGREHGQAATQLPVSSRSPCSESGQNTSSLPANRRLLPQQEHRQEVLLLPANSANPGTDHAQKTAVVPTVIQRVSREIWQTAAMLSAADESAGREREKSIAPPPTSDNHTQAGRERLERPDWV